MKLRIFEEYIDFYNFLDSHDLLSAHESLEAFKVSYSLINKGCGCGKAGRVKKVEDEYLKLTSNMDQELLNKIKVAGQFGSIQMYFHGNLIFQG